MSNKTKNNEVAQENKSATENVKINKKMKDNKKTKKQPSQKKGGLGKKLKETGSELKKVNWPSFSKVVKNTGIVLSVVVIFTLILLCIDYLLSTLFSLLA